MYLLAPCVRTVQTVGTLPRSFKGPFCSATLIPPLAGTCHSSTCGPAPSSNSTYTLWSKKVRLLADVVESPRYVRFGFNSFSMRLSCATNPLEQFHDSMERLCRSAEAKRRRWVMKVPVLVRVHSGRVTSVYQFRLSSIVTQKGVPGEMSMAVPGLDVSIVEGEFPGTWW